MRYLFTFLLIIPFILPSTHAFALPSPESLKEQISETSIEIQKLDAQIKKYQEEINKTTSQKQSLSALIKELTLTRSKLLTEVNATKKKISMTGDIISDLTDEIDIKEQQIAIAKEALRNSLKQMYQEDSTSFMETILSSEDISYLSDEFNNKQSINERVVSFKKTVETIQYDLNLKKKTKEEEQIALGKLKTNLANEQKAVELAKKEKDTLLTTTKNKESNYKKLLEEQQKKKIAFEKELRDYESQLKFVLNQKLLPAPGSGVLSWPLDTVFITQLFGVTGSSKRLYTSGSHSGVDFRATVGTPVRAMASGTVLGVGNTDDFCKGASFGKWVFIEYNNGLSSTYGHLSSISAKAGQVVKAGDIVALSGNTGHSTGPHLHVAVYASQGAKVDTLPSKSCSGKSFIMPIAPTNAYLDPMLYLPGTTAAMYKKEAPRD